MNNSEESGLTPSMSILGDEIGLLTNGISALRKHISNRSRWPQTLADLASQKIHVSWRVDEARGGAKVPYNPHTLKMASVTNPKAWGTLADAQQASERLLAGGIKGGTGIILGPLAGSAKVRLCGIDLDSCLDDQGEPIGWAKKVVERFASYTEISPSGSGLKVFFLVTSDDIETVRKIMGKSSSGGPRSQIRWTRGKHEEIALDLGKRYYTVTGSLLNGSSKILRSISLVDLEWLISTAGPGYQSDHGNAAQRDESGSGHGYRFLLAQVRAGTSKPVAIERLMLDDHQAGEWAGRAGKRQINRAWDKAEKVAEENDADRFDSWDDDFVERLNSRHAVVQHGGKTLISHREKSGRITFGDERYLHTLYANDLTVNAQGKPVSVSKAWIAHPNRRTYPDGIVFDPGNLSSGTSLNLWDGYEVDPDPNGSCELLMAHLLDVVCDGDSSLFDYIIGWWAHVIQRPEEKPGVALVLRGEKGTGKDTVADYFASAIGKKYCPTVAHSEYIVGRFNWRLQTALVLHVQEGSWAGDKKAESQLKYLVTSESIEIERKGIDSFQMPSVLRVFISANAEWIVPASPDERRWAIVDVSNKRRGDREYFGALHAEKNGSGPAALLAFLLDYDLSRFDVREVPQTQGLAKQKLASLKNAALWWYQTLENGDMYVETEDQNWHNSILELLCADVQSDYTEWMGAQNYQGGIITDSQLGKFLKQACPSLEVARPSQSRSPQRARCYQFPPLDICREQFATWLGSELTWDEE
jgi:hypothetical protein